MVVKIAKETESWDISHYSSDEGVKDVLRILGKSKISPDFVDRIDERLWKDYWKGVGGQFGFSYIHGQDRFDKDKRTGEYWNKDTMDSFDGNMGRVLSAYSVSAIKYNRDIAHPLIKERKGLLDKVVVDMKED